MVLQKEGHSVVAVPEPERYMSLEKAGVSYYFDCLAGAAYEGDATQFPAAHCPDRGTCSGRQERHSSSGAPYSDLRG